MRFKLTTSKTLGYPHISKKCNFCTNTETCRLKNPFIYSSCGSLIQKIYFLLTEIDGQWEYFWRSIYILNLTPKGTGILLHQCNMKTSKKITQKYKFSFRKYFIQLSRTLHNRTGVVHVLLSYIVWNSGNVGKSCDSKG